MRIPVLVAQHVAVADQLQRGIQLCATADVLPVGLAAVSLGPGATMQRECHRAPRSDLGDERVRNLQRSGEEGK